MKFVKEVCSDHGVRMHRTQKEKFREYVTQNAKEMNYKIKLEKNFLASNIVVGDPDKAKVVFTAHYDTPPRLPKFLVKHMGKITLLILLGMFSVGGILELMMSFGLYSATATLSKVLMSVLPVLTALGTAYTFGFLGGANKKNFNDNSSGCIMMLQLMDKYKSLKRANKDKIAFVFTDNEEKMLLGSLSYASKHKNYKEQTCINLDCVGRGKNFNMYYFGKEPTPVAKELQEQINKDKQCQAYAVKSGIMSLSDHFAFRRADHVCVLTTDIGKDDSIYDQIHSSNDYMLEEENLVTLSKAISNLSCMQETEKALLAISRKTAISRTAQKVKNYFMGIDNKPAKPIVYSVPLKEEEKFSVKRTLNGLKDMALVLFEKPPIANGQENIENEIK